LSEMWINVSMRGLKHLHKQVYKTYTFIDGSHYNKWI